MSMQPGLPFCVDVSDQKRTPGVLSYGGTAEDTISEGAHGCCGLLVMYLEERSRDHGDTNQE